MEIYILGVWDWIEGVYDSEDKAKKAQAKLDKWQKNSSYIEKWTVS